MKSLHPETIQIAITTTAQNYQKVNRHINQMSDTLQDKIGNRGHQVIVNIQIINNHTMIENTMAVDLITVAAGEKTLIANTLMIKKRNITPRDRMIKAVDLVKMIETIETDSTGPGTMKMMVNVIIHIQMIWIRAVPEKGDRDPRLTAGIGITHVPRKRTGLVTNSMIMIGHIIRIHKMRIDEKRGKEIIIARWVVIDIRKQAIVIKMIERCNNNPLSDRKVILTKTKI